MCIAALSLALSYTVSVPRNGSDVEILEIRACKSKTHREARCISFCALFVQGVKLWLITCLQLLLKSEELCFVFV